MEKAILKTFVYSELFDYPLKFNEIHKWLIGKKANLRQIESALLLLGKKRRIKSKQDYYFLGRKDGLVSIRKRKERQSAGYLRKAQLISNLFKLIPWVKLVGISGGLSMENAQKSDDIDLFIITGKNRLWLSRLFVLSLISLTGQRRKVGEAGRKVSGKLCVNILLEEDKLEQHHKDIYVAHEVLQMKVLWERNGIYKKYLEDNEWVFKFLPNWVGPGPVGSQPHSISTSLPLFDLLEILAKRFQLRIMEKPKGLERIEDGALYFHPNDCRQEILNKFKKRISKFT